jgi:hypothetical protein
MIRTHAASVTFMAGVLLQVAVVASGSPQSTSCPRLPITCAPPASTPSFVQINLEPDSGGGCKFDPRQVEDLKLRIGDNVYWSFCNKCDSDMTVQLDSTGGSGPFDHFRTFVPLPLNDNMVSVPVPCNDYGSALGGNATREGAWKYSMRVGTAGSGSFPDVIDPRLEIDDRRLARGLSWLLLILLGGSLGWLGRTFAK